MKKFSEFWHSVKEKGDMKGRDKLLLLVLTGILLLVIVWPVSDNTGGQSDIQEEQQTSPVTGTDDYVTVMEQRLEAILENVEGAGKVAVMITVKDSGEQIVEKDESYFESSSQNASGSSPVSADSVSRSESTIYDQASGGSPYVVQELKPAVEGVLVVAEGAGDETVVNEITYAVQVLFDVPVHKIKVAKMSSR